MSGVSKRRRSSSSQSGPNYPLYKLSRFLHVGALSQQQSSLAGSGLSSSSSLRGEGGSSSSSSSSSSASATGSGRRGPRALASALFGSSGSQSPRGEGGVAPMFSKENVQITRVVVASSPTFPNGHAFTAVSLSSNDILLRFISECNIPVVQHIPWSKSSEGDSIVDLAFDPTAQWLLVANADSTLTLLGVYFLCCSRHQRTAGGLDPAPGSSRSLKQYVDPTELRILNRLSPDRPHVIKPRRSSGQTTCCSWWKPFDRNGDFGIIGTATGVINIINLVSGEECVSVKLKVPIWKVTLVTDPSLTYRYLLIQTENGYYRLLLEREVSTKSYQSILSTPNISAQGSPFLPQLLTQFGTDAEIDLQHTNFGPILRVFHRQTQQLEIFSPDMGRFPLFVYQMPRGTVATHYTLAFTFAFADPAQVSGSSASTVSLVSNMIAATAAVQKRYSRRNPSVMQRFQFDPDERFGGFFCFPSVSPAMLGSSQSDIGRSGGSGSLLGPVDPTGFSTALTSLQSTSSDKSLQVCFLWTNKAIYHCRPVANPERVFHELITDNCDPDDVENLGKTLSLDLLRLYEQAADQAYDKKDYARALSLYALSNVRPSRLIMRFVSVNRLDIVVTYVRGLLHNPEALPGNDRKQLSDVLFQVYLLRLLPEIDNGGAFIRDFEQYICENKDYNEITAMKLLMSHGAHFTRLFLLVAHVRGQVPYALNMLSEAGRLHLSPEDFAFLCENGHIEDIKNQRQMFAMLPPVVQARAILSNPQTLMQHFFTLASLLPVLPGDLVSDIVRIFDPMHSVFSIGAPSSAAAASVTAAAASTSGRRNSISPSSTFSEHDGVVTQEDLVELHLSALMVLTATRYSGAKQASITSSEPVKEGESEDGKSKKVALPSLTLANPKKGDEKNSTDDETSRYFSKSLLQPIVSPKISVQQISCGHRHSLAVTSEGAVYSWGANSNGELGLGFCGKPMKHPQRVDSLARVPTMRVAAGGNHSFAVSKTGTVWAWGLNSSGQLGIGQRSEGNSVFEVSPCRVEALKKVWIRQIACGHAHTLLNTESGVILACGANDKGQLGLNHTTSVNVPTQVKLHDPHRTESVACGYDHSCCCTEVGDVYTWGNGDHGQLGLGKTTSELRPKRVTELDGKHVIVVFCGHHHTAVLTDLLVMYIWGRGDCHQLGTGEVVDVHVPHKMSNTLNYQRISCVSCGNKHSLAYCESGELYAWGSGEFGALGRGNTSLVPIPQPITALSGTQINYISCGEAFSAAITSAGDLYMWGANDAGQLGIDSEEKSFASPMKVEMCPSSSSFTGTSDPDAVSSTLRSALRNHWGTYRPGVVLQCATHLKLWDAVALIHELSGDLRHSFATRLLGISDQCLRTGADECEEVFKLVEEDLPRFSGKEDSMDCTTLLLYLLMYWEKRGLPLPRVAEFISKHMNELSYPMAQLLMASSSDDDICLRVMTPQQRLDVIKTAFVALSDPSCGNTSINALLNEISSNIPHEASRRDVVVLKTNDAVDKARREKRPNEPLVVDTVVFSCGHQYTRRDLMSSLLPAFSKHLDEMKPSLPLTASLATAEYKQKYITLACPKCLLGAIKKNDAAIKPL